MDVFNETNGTQLVTPGINIRSASPWDDATWILTSSFIIFTMQSGFGLLESGMASRKNEVNIMVKNVVDVVFGGLSYWMFGYGFSFGRDKGTNVFCGIGSFFLDPDPDDMGSDFSKFIFQASFATTATTIVSGAMAERCRLMAYIVFSFVNTFIYCFPAHWVWSEDGWLKQMNVVDFAGDGPVHLVGGTSALMAAYLLKPRHQRFTEHDDHQMGAPTNAMLGMFILWWGWLGFNCGSTFGISGGKWKIAARTAATTILSSCGGGAVALSISYFMNKRKFDISFLINGILGSLVSITGICAVTSTWEAAIIGGIGAAISVLGELLLEKLKIDDPVGAIPTHGFCAIWGLLACGIFTHKDTVEYRFSTRNGLIWGGGFVQLGIQVLAIVSIIAWTACMSFIFLKLIDKFVGLRLELEEEILGADIVEHCIGYPIASSRMGAMSRLSRTENGDRRGSYKSSNGDAEEVSRTVQAMTSRLEEGSCGRAGQHQQARRVSGFFGRRSRVYPHEALVLVNNLDTSVAIKNPESTVNIPSTDGGDLAPSRRNVFMQVMEWCRTCRRNDMQ